MAQEYAYYESHRESVSSFVKLPIADVREFLNTRKFTVMWSGGKDSTATLLWVLDNVSHNNWDVLYIEITGNTHPECTRYVVETAKQLGVYNKLKIVRREDLNFFDLLGKYGIPIPTKTRWCYAKFKYPFLSDPRTTVVHVNGMRASDSYRRKMLFAEVVYSKLTEKIWVMPLWTWTKNQVLDYIKKHGIGVNPCYKLYGHSGNCMFCPYHDKKSILLTLRDPEWGHKIVEALRSVHCGDSAMMKRIKDRWMLAWQLMQNHKPLVRA